MYIPEVLTTQFRGKLTGTHPNLEVDNELKTSNEGLLPYESGEELLNDMLSKGSYLHQKQLVHLSQLHQDTVLKIRFSQPIFICFLAAGQEQYLLILETLDTEEATYIRHLYKIYFSYGMEANGIL